MDPMQAQDDEDHAARVRRDVRVLPGRPGAVLGRQRRARRCCSSGSSPSACEAGDKVNGARPDAHERDADERARRHHRRHRHRARRRRRRHRARVRRDAARDRAARCSARAPQPRHAHYARVPRRAPARSSTRPAAVVSRRRIPTPARTWSSCRRTAARSCCACCCALPVELGARPARPGEFTERAFLNGKLDLAQAEAVADLIASRLAKPPRARRGAASTASSRERVARADRRR